ncbi:MAG: hypothetical protein P1U86_17360 [Verrucomicrobiales bacterium]|nr:hypothetical protein [Verrucomicrobiales bacterium]
MNLDQKSVRYGWMDYLYLVKSRWPLVFLVAAAIFVVAAGIWSQKPRVYEVTALIAASEVNSKTYLDTGLSTSFYHSGRPSMDRSVHQLMSAGLLARVVSACNLTEEWGLSSDAHAILNLKKRLKTRPDLDDDSQLELLVRDLSPEMAMKIANAWGEKFVELKRSQAVMNLEDKRLRLESEIKTRNAQIADLETRLKMLATGEESRSDEVVRLRREMVREINLTQSLEAKRQQVIAHKAVVAPGVSLVDKATLDGVSPVGVSTSSIVLTVLAGVLFGAAFALATSRGRPGFVVAAKMAKEMELELVGFAPVPDRKSPPGTPLPFLAMEPYRHLRTEMGRLPGKECVVISFLPVGNESDLDSAVSNLAKVMADGGRTVLLVDANLHDSQLHTHFDAANHPGLSDYLSGEMRLEETVIKSRHSNVWLMPSGPMHQDPCGLITNRRMDDLLWEMRSRFDFILMATPSIEGYSEVGVLAEKSDYVVGVSSYWDFSRRKLKRTKLAVELAKKKLSGVIFSRPFNLRKQDGMRAAVEPINVPRPGTPAMGQRLRRFRKA